MPLWSETEVLIHELTEVISVWFHLLHLSFRDLNLGAKAEIAIGKHYIDLDKITRTELTNLLNGTEHEKV